MIKLSILIFYLFIQKFRYFNNFHINLSKFDNFCYWPIYSENSDISAIFALSCLHVFQILKTVAYTWTMCSLLTGCHAFLPLFLYFHIQYSMPLNTGFWKSFHGRVSGASCAQGLLATLSGIWLSGPLWWLDSLSSMRRLVCHIGSWSIFSLPVIAATPNRAKLTRPASCWHSYKILPYNFRR